MKKYEELKKLIQSMEGDFLKFYNKNNAAAGTRVRQYMQELKSMGDSIRKEVQSIKNSK